MRNLTTHIPRPSSAAPFPDLLFWDPQASLDLGNEPQAVFLKYEGRHDHDVMAGRFSDSAGRVLPFYTKPAPWLNHGKSLLPGRETTVGQHGRSPGDKTGGACRLEQGCRSPFVSDVPPVGQALLQKQWRSRIRLRSTAILARLPTVVGSSRVGSWELGAGTTDETHPVSRLS